MAALVSGRTDVAAGLFELVFGDDPQPSVDEKLSGDPSACGRAPGDPPSEEPGGICTWAMHHRSQQRSSRAPMRKEESHRLGAPTGAPSRYADEVVCPPREPFSW